MENNSLTRFMHYTLGALLIVGGTQVHAQAAMPTNALKNYLFGWVTRALSKEYVKSLETADTPSLPTNQTAASDLFYKAGQDLIKTDAEVYTRETLARFLEAVGRAKIEKDGPFRLGMDSCGVAVDLVNDFRAAYKAIDGTGDQVCNAARAEAYLLGSMAAYENTWISEWGSLLLPLIFGRLSKMAGASNVPSELPVFMNSLLYLALYTVNMPFLKYMSKWLTDDFHGCAGASELYDFADDVYYASSSVIPDTIASKFGAEAGEKTAKILPIFAVAIAGAATLARAKVAAGAAALLPSGTMPINMNLIDFESEENNCLA